MTPNWSYKTLHTNSLRGRTFLLEILCRQTCPLSHVRPTQVAKFGNGTPYVARSNMKNLRLELADVDAHLPGEKRIGIYSTSLDDTCTWGVIDLDWHSDVPLGDLYNLQHCEFIKYCDQNRLDLSEPLWWALASNLATLGEEGRDDFHVLSEGYEGYTPEETDAKFRVFQRDFPVSGKPAMRLASSALRPRALLIIVAYTSFSQIPSICCNLANTRGMPRVLALDSFPAFIIVMVTHKLGEIKWMESCGWISPDTPD